MLAQPSPHGGVERRRARPTNSVLCDHSADNPDAGIAACTRLLDPGHNDVNVPAIFNNRGNAWVRKGLYASAIEDFNAAIQRDPKYVEAYSSRGLAWKLSGQVDRAIADFSQAIRLDAKSAPLYNLRGAALLDKGEYDRAIVDFDAAIGLDPRFAMAFNNRGIALHPGAGIRSRDRGFRSGHRARPQEPRTATTTVPRC